MYVGNLRVNNLGVGISQLMLCAEMKEELMHELRKTQIKNSKKIKIIEERLSQGFRGFSFSNPNHATTLQNKKD